MKFTNRFIQAYKQAPWRLQLQWAGLFLLGLSMVVLIAGIYLNISTRAATAGLEVQALETEKEETQRKIADMRTKLALLTSQEMMAKRAADMGFQDVNPWEVTYLVVKGYAGRQPIILAPPPNIENIHRPLVKPAYTQSLWEFLLKGALQFSEAEKGAVQ